MLVINIPSTELYDEEHNEFITLEETKLRTLFNLTFKMGIKMEETIYK